MTQDDEEKGVAKHLGEGVIVQTNSYAIDADSSTSHKKKLTITRVEQRSAARLCIRAMLTYNIIVLIGQPGGGKTRGTLAFMLQELLACGAAVIRVDNKQDQAFLFLPSGGRYKVYFTAASMVAMSGMRGSRAIKLIDPPELAGNYHVDVTPPGIKVASNNYHKHYQNVNKDGALLVTSIPTEAEVMAMVDALWSPKTLLSGQHAADFEDADKKRDEIKRRAAIVGWVPRALFDGQAFTDAIGKIRLAAEKAAKLGDVDRIRKAIEGMLMLSAVHNNKRFI